LPFLTPDKYISIVFICVLFGGKIMSTLENKVDRLATALERMLDQGRFSGGGTTNTANSAVGANSPSLAAGANNLTTSFFQSSTGAMTLTSAIGDVTKVMGIFGKAGEVVAGITGNVANNLIEMNQNLMSSSKFGMTFGQDLGLFTEQLGLAGIGQKQWTALLQTNSAALSGTATTAQQAGQLFLSQSQQLMKSKDVLEARIAGIDLSEFQDQLLLSTNLFKFNNVGNAETQRVLQESVIKTTIEIDNMSRITAKSRQEIQKGVEQQNQSNTMRIARMAMSAQELARYEASLPMITQYGKTFADLFTEMSGNRGQIASQEGSQIAGAIENIAPGVTSLMRQLSTEQDSATRKELETRIQFEMSKGAANEENMARIVALAKRGDPVSQKLVEILTQGEGMFGAGKQFYLNSQGQYDVFKGSQKEILDAAGRARDTIDGKQPAGAQASQLINAGEAAVKAINAGLASGIAKEINEMAGKQLQSLDLSKEYLRILAIDKTLTPAELERRLKENGYTGVNTQNRTNMPNIPGADWMTNPPSSSNPLPIRGVVQIDPTAPLPRQAMGSKDVFGDWFAKDWGSGGLNIMDGKEAAVPQGKIGEFINDMVAQNPNLLAGLQGKLRNSAMENNPQASMERMFGDLSKSINIPSTVSSATGSGGVSGTLMGDNKTTSDLVAVMEKLNTKMDKLITAVEDGSNANVKAVKSRSNLIA